MRLLVGIDGRDGGRDAAELACRNSQQLNAMIETALLPDMFRKARLVVVQKSV